MKRQFFILLYFFLLLALCACGLTQTNPSATPASITTNASWLPDPDEVKALLVQLVDVEI